MKNASLHLGTSQSRVNCDRKNWSKLIWKNAVKGVSRKREDISYYI